MHMVLVGVEERDLCVLVDEHLLGRRVGGQALRQLLLRHRVAVLVLASRVWVVLRGPWGAKAAYVTTSPRSLAGGLATSGCS